MALKGTTRIELTDVKTGEVEVIEKHNMVTNVVADLLSINPLGVMYRKATDYQSAFFPLKGNAFGGILCYSEPLEEDANAYYSDMSNKVTACANMGTNDTTDTVRGSLNLTESGKLEDGTGYRFVFDFTTSQGNGQISALGLTSKLGGLAGYANAKGSEHASFTAQIEFVQHYGWVTYISAIKSIVSIDEAKNAAYSVWPTSSGVFEIRQVQIPITKVGLFDSCSGTEVNASQVLATIKPTSFGIYSGSYFYGAFCDGGDGYIYGLQQANNVAGNSSGSATIRWIKIDKSDWTFEEGSWAINAQIHQLGRNDLEYNHECNFIIDGGYLYCVKSGLTGVYKIDLSNVTDIELIYDGAVVNKCTDPYCTTNCFFNKIGNTIYWKNGRIEGGVGVNSPYNTAVVAPGLNYCYAPKLHLGPYLLTFGSYLKDCTGLTRAIYIMTPYLATINNLETPVTKTADKIMKITYILREE